MAGEYTPAKFYVVAVVFYVGGCSIFYGGCAK